MADKRIVTRAEGGIVPLSHTTARVARPSNTILCHYTGGSGPSVGDGMNDRQHMELLQRQMINNGKTWEYNYIITAPTGVVWEVAGEFQSAHCLNANGFAYGCQMNLGVGAAPSQDMVDSWRWLRTELVNRGQLTANHNAKPHYWLRDTACCGGMMATPPGGSWASPTGQGHVGDLLPFMLVPWQTTDGGLIVTPEDRSYLDSQFGAVSKQIAAIWKTILQGRDGQAYEASTWLVGTNANSWDTLQGVNKILAAAAGFDPEMIKKAIKDAVAELPGLPVDEDSIANAVYAKLYGSLIPPLQ